MDMDRFNTQLEEMIASAGWAVIATATVSDDLPFAYTVGLTTHGLPELVITGLEAAVTHQLLNTAAAMARAGAPLTHGQRLPEVIDGFAMTVLDATEGIERIGVWPGAALERYGDSVRLFQLVWPDQNARFPWDPGCALPPAAQPVLTKL